MAKYEVNYICGHTGVVELFGKEKDRQSKIAWMEKTLSCPDCRKAEAKDEKEELLKTFNLPTLTGSEKQVKWAEDLRGDFARISRHAWLREKSPRWAYLLNCELLATALKDLGGEMKTHFKDFHDKGQTTITFGDKVFTVEATHLGFLALSMTEYALEKVDSAKWWIDSRYDAKTQKTLIKEWADWFKASI